MLGQLMIHMEKIMYLQLYNQSIPDRSSTWTGKARVNNFKIRGKYICQSG